VRALFHAGGFKDEACHQQRLSDMLVQKHELLLLL
jgi:hypothetical protein